MKLSIITVNYNNKSGLERTIQSVLSQTCQDFEWIVIDGGSTDGSKQLIESHSDRINYWVSEPDMGIYNAMNKAIKIVNGEYCLFLNSGDSLDADNILEVVFPHLGGVDYLFGDVRLVDLDGNELGIFINPLNPPIGFWLYLNVCHQSMFIHTDTLKHRPYREELGICADWEHVFHDVIIEHCTTKSIRLVISDVTDGGYASVNGERHMREKYGVIDEVFTKEAAAASIIEYCKSRPQPNFEISRFAYISFVNRRYNRDEFIRIFSPYSKELRSGGPVYMSIVNLLNLWGFPRIARLVKSSMNILRR